MFQTTQTFKDLFLRTVSRDLYKELKKVDNIKLVSKEINMDTIKDKLFEESFIIVQEDVAVIVCDIKLELKLKEKFLAELERTALVLCCSSLEFENSNNDISSSDFASKLKIMYENS